ncbi:adenylyl-sulfate kinase [Mucilaginibacter xinganensis]|uniref:Adenylyl-sulfate kinase n=1 Tax=Mucilaginibacter xinganensis TaxID=1234841 RepID=A0A223NWN9_9SPHI|nr:adenylyl-sulfate kinase [Mucilaginibacter xinganensis]ASU34275.1 adenylyl-sulfate kinase [Mucilaginibacter xinganensis]
MLIIQLTGLSGSGKTTLSQFVKQALEDRHLTVEIIDGDTYRKTLCRDLGFSVEDRCENIRRLGHAAHSFAGSRDVVIIAAINPFEHIRKELEIKYGIKTVWINCNVDVLIARDTKGLYRRALLPEDHPDKLHNLTGINDSYDTPVNYALLINTHMQSTAQCGGLLCDFILQHIG